MPTIDVYNQSHKKVASATLGAGWEAPLRRAAVVEATLWQMQNRRAGTSSTKTRSEVRGSGRKIYRQKGTGRARHGDRQAPIFVGGGIAGGPRPRDWSYALPKKARRKAIQSLLIDKLRRDRIRVLDALDFGEIKTKAASDFFAKAKIPSALVVLDEAKDNVIRSIRNLNDFKTCRADSLNAVDLLRYEYLILTKASLETLEKLWVPKA